MVKRPVNAGRSSSFVAVLMDAMENGARGKTATSTDRRTAQLTPLEQGQPFDLPALLLYLSGSCAVLGCLRFSHLLVLLSNG